MRRLPGWDVTLRSGRIRPVPNPKSRKELRVGRLETFLRKMLGGYVLAEYSGMVDNTGTHPFRTSLYLDTVPFRTRAARLAPYKASIASPWMRV